ncbi:hypothetical protein [Streptomyces sp. NPDC059916]|uniref:hypothetical protein n=1 Tax=Streptomyces sp. NPDC059916 TaxID=3347001 RepID=UPI0036C3A81D
MSNPLDNEHGVYVEFHAGDGGVHDVNSPDPWYYSPDIDVQKTPPVQGEPNKVKVRAHLHPQYSMDVSVEAWIGIPGPTFDPQDPASIKRIGKAVIPAAAFAQVPGASGLLGATEIDWTPESDGHKCLVVRAYPKSGVDPSDKSFFLPDDPHAAQHNIFIVPATKLQTAPDDNALPAGRDGLWHTPVGAANVAEPPAEAGATFLVQQDLGLSAAVRGALLPYLQAYPSFQTFAKRPGGRVELAVPAALQPTVPAQRGCGYWLCWICERLPAPVRAACRRCAPSARVDATLPPTWSGKLSLGVDLSTTQVGEAQVYNVRQYDRSGAAQGGLTVVFLVVS